MKEINKLGEKIKQLRISKGITRERFAIETDIARSYIYRIEQGDCNPSIGTLIQVAKGLDISVKELIDF